ncbi:hypothetical protein ACEQ8H_000512 [Pleosporales sp. CAS-2024a]
MPQYVHLKSGMPVMSYRMALAQICRRIRAEYQPIYLKRAKLAVCWTDLPAFLADFYGRDEVFIHGPRNLFVCINHPMPRNDLFDVLPIIKIRMRLPSFACKMLRLHDSCNREPADVRLFQVMDASNSLQELIDMNDKGWLTLIRHGIIAKVDAIYVLYGMRDVGLEVPNCNEVLNTTGLRRVQTILDSLGFAFCCLGRQHVREGDSEDVSKVTQRRKHVILQMLSKHGPNHNPPLPLLPSTPPRQQRAKPATSATYPAVPPRPLFPAMAATGGDMIMGGENVRMPPSPGFLREGPEQLQEAPASPGLAERKTKRRAMPKDRTGAGVKKPRSPTGKSSITIKKLMDATGAGTAPTGEDALFKPFRFTHLPGELRNLVYQHAFSDPKQALLVHRPRMASLRPRTRLDRQRALESDVKDRELGYQLSLDSEKTRRTNKDSKSYKKRETNRPFWGLTQVSHQIREEFRPIYLEKQEIGMDLTEIVEYLKIFYFNAPAEFEKLKLGNGPRSKDLSFNGNLTIAVGEKPSDVEKSKAGVEVLPLLDIWANSFQIEAGFGRYLKADYVPQIDGEAKDLYRLFGRRVLKNRQCSSMNHLWRTVLRSRALASVTLHRKPAPRTVESTTVPLAALPPAFLMTQQPLPAQITIDTKPYVHFLFRGEHAEPWMTTTDSTVPDGWLFLRGFGSMEFFDVKVGVAPIGFDHRIR